jgi:hypothetical protein
LDKIACPYCGQDWLYWYRVKGEAETFLLCKECESVWLREQPVTEDAELNLSTHLPRFSAEDVWDQIEQL